jgi:hypothetical protein
MGDLSKQIGERVSRKVFAKRGNRKEAHLTEAELAAIVEAGVELYSSILHPKRRAQRCAHGVAHENFCNTCD